METPPTTASFSSSSSSSEGCSISNADLNKKRKLQYESGTLDMSSPKQRYRVGTNIFGQGLMVIRGSFSEEPNVKKIQSELEQPEESEKDSNSFVGGYDNSMPSDAKDSNENIISLTIHQNQPSTSLNSYSNEALKTHLCSLESRSMEEVNSVVSVDMDDILQFDPGYKTMEDTHTGVELDNAILDFASEADAETETMIFYSNDVAPESFILSSGRWNLGEGAPLGAARKPTIDQEFEQYFSSLLL